MLMRPRESVPPGERASTHSCAHAARGSALPAGRVRTPREYNILFFLPIRPVGGFPRRYLLWSRLFKLRALSAGDGAIITGPRQSLRREARAVSSRLQDQRAAKRISAKARGRKTNEQDKEESLFKHQREVALVYIDSIFLVF